VRGGAKVNTRDKKGFTALTQAARTGHSPIAQALLEAGAEINKEALVMAAFYGHAAVVQTLLDAGADVNAKYKGGLTALTAAAERGHTAVVELLKKAGAKE
jgi:hypothetical protein